MELQQQDKQGEVKACKRKKENLEMDQTTQIDSVIQNQDFVLSAILFDAVRNSGRLATTGNPVKKSVQKDENLTKVLDSDLIV